MRWQVFYKVRPFGPEFDEMAAGIVAASAHNAAFGRKTAAAPLDFMPFIKKQDAGGEQTPAQQKSFMRMLAARKAKR